MLLSSYSFAQPRSLGATFSFTGPSICYEHELGKENSFIVLEMKAQAAEFYTGHSSYPGVSASANWNMVVKQWTSPEDNTINLIAGSGLIVGYCADHKSAHGLMYGLKGRVGVECHYDRNIIISACISPIIGSHLMIYDDHVVMKYFRNGIQYALIPEIGIKYRF